jgi:hypothetical protein
VVDDAGAGLQIVVDTVAHQTVGPIVEDHFPLRHCLSGVAVDLDAVGEQTGLTARDLHVADGDQEIGGATYLLDLVGHDGGLLVAGGDRDGAGLRPRGCWLRPARHRTRHRQQEAHEEHRSEATHRRSTGADRVEGTRERRHRPHANSAPAREKEETDRANYLTRRPFGQILGRSPNDCR